MRHRVSDLMHKNLNNTAWFLYAYGVESETFHLQSLCSLHVSHVFEAFYRQKPKPFQDMVANPKKPPPIIYALNPINPTIVYIMYMICTVPKLYCLQASPSCRIIVGVVVHLVLRYLCAIPPVMPQTCTS